MEILAITSVANLIRGRINVFLAIPLMWIAGFYLGDWRAGTIAAIGFYVWQLFPWGHLIGLGRFEPDRDEHWFSIALRRTGSRHAALAVGHMIFITPTVIALCVLVRDPVMMIAAPVFGLLVMLCYEIGWHVNEERAIALGELLAGLCWGLLLWSFLR